MLFIDRDKIAGDCQQVLNHIRMPANHNRLTRVYNTLMKPNQSFILELKGSIGRLQVTQDNFPVFYADFCMVFAGRGGIDVDMPLAPEYESAAFHALKVGPPFIIHSFNLIPAAPVNIHQRKTHQRLVKLSSRLHC